jgi:hypothetical protein
MKMAKNGPLNIKSQTINQSNILLENHIAFSYSAFAIN